MPSKASMLVLIARAARSVAAATSRFAHVAEQAALLPKAEATAAASHALDRVGAGDLFVHRSAAGSPSPAMAATPLAMDAPNHRVDGWIGPGIPLKDVRMPKMDQFVPQEKDLESDEALRALYERWCKAFNQKRDHDEMARRFNKFKSMALLVHRTNNANLPYKLELNKFADGKLREMRANPDGHDFMLARKYGKSSVLCKPGGDFLREVFADFKVVDGKLFVIYPKGSKAGGGCFKELSVKYEVAAGRLFVDLPEEHELVVPSADLL
ncbi:unnamed protein product [Urochloa decumbens]|uniref:Cathepsin propeptide inhibitor domain-containing protein n=1 Tax=Urochloa decumbens TaxID=240449 RepID=A0ABC8WHH4_9POAL